MLDRLCYLYIVYLPRWVPWPNWVLARAGRFAWICG